MMKKSLLLILLMMASISGLNAQILEPVKWSTSVEKISSTEYNLVATATIDAGWHLYSQFVPEGGPIPTTFVFEENNMYSNVGATSEDKGRTVDDKIFDMKITYFDKKASFKQRIKISDKSISEVLAEVEFMVCNDERCLSPTYLDLTFKL